MRNSQSFQQVYCQLFQYIHQNALLPLHCLFISANEAPSFWNGEPFQNFVSVLRQRFQQLLLCQVLRRRTQLIVLLSTVYKRMPAHWQSARHDEGIAVNFGLGELFFLVNFDGLDSFVRGFTFLLCLHQ